MQSHSTTSPGHDESDAAGSERGSEFDVVKPLPDDDWLVRVHEPSNGTRTHLAADNDTGKLARIIGHIVVVPGLGRASVCMYEGYTDEEREFLIRVATTARNPENVPKAEWRAKTRESDGQILLYSNPLGYFVDVDEAFMAIVESSGLESSSAAPRIATENAPAAGGHQREGEVKTAEGARK